MTLTKKGLHRLADNVRMLLAPEQEKAILERFGTEPYPYAWSEQDITCQIDIYLSCGKFEKPVKVHSRSCPLPEGVF